VGTTGGIAGIVGGGIAGKGGGIAGAGDATGMAAGCGAAPAAPDMGHGAIDEGEAKPSFPRP
jgi:hypothetical protein